MNKTINILQVSKYYSDLLTSCSAAKPLGIKLGKRDLSKAIYFHMCKMRYANWKHRVDFNRKRAHSLSDFFQDIIAFYLKIALPEYTVELETKEGNTQPDIALKLNNKYVFLIEVKTTIGWERLIKSRPEEFVDRYTKRIKGLHKNFGVEKENIIYIFETPLNAGKEFEEIYWKNKPMARPTDFPYSIIFPLFVWTDPYYHWDIPKNLDKDKKYLKISDSDIEGYAKNRIVTPFEDIVKLITTRTLSEKMV